VPGDLGGSTWDGTGDTEDGGEKKRTGKAAVMVSELNRLYVSAKASNQIIDLISDFDYNV
jgi:hypothetical protein